MASRQKKKSIEQALIPLDSLYLSMDKVVLYFLTQHPDITDQSLYNLSRLLYIWDKTAYSADMELQAKMHLIVQINKLRKNAFAIYDNVEPIILSIAEQTMGNLGRIIKENILPVILYKVENEPLSTGDIHYINQFAIQITTYASYYILGQEVTSQFRSFQEQNYDNVEAEMKEIEASIAKWNYQIKKIRLEDSTKVQVDFNQDSFRRSTENIVTELKKPGNFLNTGVQYLNKLLGINGGFEVGRVYAFIGAAGRFKSGLLLNILKWIATYNNDIPKADPHKRLCILYITQENTINETYERFFNLLNDQNIRNFSTEEVYQIIEDQGFLDPDRIEIKLRFWPHKAISTDDLYPIIDGIENDGYQIIGVIHDYIKRIRSSDPHDEMRIELANIINEFSVLAKIKNIPFITAHQLNREALSRIELAVQKGRGNSLNEIGASQIGESHGVLENIDWAAIINKEEEDSEGNTYISFKRVKARIKCDESLKSFLHPFVGGSSMRIQEDLYEEKSLSIFNKAEANITEHIKKLKPIPSLATMSSPKIAEEKKKLVTQATQKENNYKNSDKDFIQDNTQHTELDDNEEV